MKGGNGSFRYSRDPSTTAADGFRGAEGIFVISILPFIYNEVGDGSSGVAADPQRFHD
jgi:hypothetical protein